MNGLKDWGKVPTAEMITFFWECPKAGRVNVSKRQPCLAPAAHFLHHLYTSLTRKRLNCVFPFTESNRCGCYLELSISAQDRQVNIFFVGGSLSQMYTTVWKKWWAETKDVIGSTSVQRWHTKKEEKEETSRKLKCNYKNHLLIWPRNPLQNLIQAHLKLFIFCSTTQKNEETFTQPEPPLTSGNQCYNLK